MGPSSPVALTARAGGRHDPVSVRWAHGKLSVAVSGYSVLGPYIRVSLPLTRVF